jgi:hypothetical protein
MERNFIRNVSKTALAFNLPKDDQGKPRSLHLSKGEISPALSQEDVSSAEVQKAIKGRFVINVTAQMLRK